MSLLIKSSSKMALLRGLMNPFRQAFVPGLAKREFTRNLWYMSKSQTNGDGGVIRPVLIRDPSILCSCPGAVQAQKVHTKVEQELVEFLTEEILAEKKSAPSIDRAKKLFPDYKLEVDGSDVTLKKDSGKEVITITFNVNHTVDLPSDGEGETEGKLEPLQSTPQFEVDITRGSKTLGFTCSFIGEPAQDDEYGDTFGIDELTVYEGEWNDKKYAVAGDVLDGHLYDLLLSYLEERGINNEFADKISELSTIYEQSQYIKLLEDFSKFVTTK